MNIIYQIWLISIAVFPFFKGGYFYYINFAFAVVQGLILLKILKSKKKIIVNKINIAYLIIILLATVNTLFSIDKGMNFIGVIKISIVFTVMLNYNFFACEYSKKIINKKLSRLLTMVALIMVITQSISIVINRGDYFIQSNRIGGYFQYANTNAIFLFAIMCIYFSYNVIGSKDKTYKNYIAILILAFGISLANSRYMFFLILIIIFVLLAKKYIIESFVIMIGIISGIGFINIIPKNMDAFRSLSIINNSSTWMSRLLYYEDALKMIFLKPFGYGHMGYYYIQGTYQTGANYNIKFVHSSILQLALDYGIICSIIWMIFGITIIMMIIKYKNDYNKVFICIVLGIMYLHTMIEWDMQFTVIPIIIYFLYNMIIENERKYIFKSKKIIQSVFIIIECIYIYLLLTTSFNYIEKYKLSYNICKVYTENIDDILINAKKQEYEEVSIIARKAIARNKYYKKAYIFLRNKYYYDKDYLKSIYYAKKILELEPLNFDYLEDYVKISMKYIKKYEVDKDEKYLVEEYEKQIKEILNLENYIKKLEKSRKNNYTIRHEVNFVLNDYILKQIEYVKNINNVSN